MEDISLVLTTWFHLIAIVIWVGLIINSLILFFPLVNTIDRSAKAKFLIGYRHKSIAITLIAVVVFTITGFALILMNENDQGIGNVFANSWTTQIFAKHLAILIMLILEFWLLYHSLPKLINLLQKTGENKESLNSDADRQLNRLMKQNLIASISLSVLGLVVLFLIAALP